jgi:hypothetical protein
MTRDIGERFKLGLTPTRSTPQKVLGAVFFAALVLVCAVLTGCATKPPVYVPEAVLIPIPVKPAQPPADLDRPVMPIAALTDLDTPDVVLKAYVATVELLKSMVIERDRVLDEYRKGIITLPAPPVTNPAPQGASK